MSRILLVEDNEMAICAPIAPYDSVRKDVRQMIECVGGFVMVYLSTPLHICEHRERKGLYAKARAGLIQQFTGISDPYEPPEDAEIVVDTTNLAPEHAVDVIVRHLARRGYIDVDSSGAEGIREADEPLASSGSFRRPL